MITIIMPVYNEERYLVSAIDSILGQTFLDFEFLIINDGSTDQTCKIIKDKMKVDSRIKLISNGCNVGLASSLNIGLRNSKYNVIARMDGDDISMPDRLNIQYAIFKTSNSILALSYCYIKLQDTKPVKQYSLVKTHRDIAKYIKNGLSFYHGCFMFDKNRILDEGGYNEDYTMAEDYELMLRLLVNGHKFLMVPQYLYCWRKWEGNTSQHNKHNYTISRAFEVKKAQAMHIKPVRN